MIEQTPDTEGASIVMTFSCGDRVNWRYDPRGGYCQPMSIAGVVEKGGKSKVTLRVAKRDQGVWTQVLRIVDPAKLTPWERACAELGEA